MKKALIMGIGLHGGGLSTLKYLLPYYKRIHITDLRDPKTLGPTIKKIKELTAGYEGDLSMRLGSHEAEDFKDADIIIKNPAVRLNSPYLKELKDSCVKATDISLFLAQNTRPLIIVSGSKGKSSTASWIAHSLKHAGLRDTDLAGNIGLSPLELIAKDGTTKDPIVLELSSWQLRDLRWSGAELKGHIAVLTSIYADHQNSYDSMDDYVNDKRSLIDGAQAYIYPQGNQYLDPELDAETATHRGAETLCIPCKPNTPIATVLKGQHAALSLAIAYAVGKLFDREEHVLIPALSSFEGIAHRMERIQLGKRLFINDSAATIPQATVEGLRAYSGAVLLSGGTDKELDFEGIFRHYKHAKRIYLLRGSATTRLYEGLQAEGIKVEGIYQNLDKALDAIQKELQEDEVLLFSPGATSFELFLHEFDRGNQFVAGVKKRWG